MSTTQEVHLPDIGDFDEVDVIEVLVSAGDVVALDDSLVTLESDKATMEIPSPFAGRVVELTVALGDKVGQGALLALIDKFPITTEPAVAIKRTLIVLFPAAFSATIVDGLNR